MVCFFMNPHKCFNWGKIKRWQAFTRYLVNLISAAERGWPGLFWKGWPKLSAYKLNIHVYLHVAWLKIPNNDLRENKKISLSMTQMNINVHFFCVFECLWSIYISKGEAHSSRGSSLLCFMKGSLDTKWVGVIALKCKTTSCRSHVF